MKIKLITNKKKPWAVSLEKKVSSFLKKYNFQIVKKNADVTLCIGGDGTILYPHHRGWVQGAVLGIGSETSHMCIIRKDNWRKMLLNILRKNKKENRLTLSARIGEKKYESINDIVVHTHDYRIIELFVRINGRNHSFEGDGVIISTPTGSTAYAYSAGGPILNPYEKNIEVVPICPYKRRFSPTVLSRNAVVKISIDRTSDLVIDGIFIKRLEPNENITIKKGKGLSFLTK